MTAYGRALVDLPVVDPVSKGDVEKLLRDHDRRSTTNGTTIGREQFCRRTYTCRKCGHETPTMGWPFSEDARCFKRIRIPGTRRTRRCGGKLVGRYG